MDIDQVLHLDRFPGHRAVDGLVGLLHPGLLGLGAAAWQPEGRQLTLTVASKVAYGAGGLVILNSKYVGA